MSQFHFQNLKFFSHTKLILFDVVRYLEKRRRNNESARKSRESRRRREKETKERISILQEENIKLRTEIQILREEICRLREHEFLQSLITNSFRTIRPNDFNR